MTPSKGMHADVVVILLLLVFGWVACLFGVLYVAWQAISAGWRGLTGLFHLRRGVSGRSCPPTTRAGALVCPRPECRKIERREARFCSQCGARLTEMPGDRNRSR